MIEPIKKADRIIFIGPTLSQSDRVEWVVRLQRQGRKSTAFIGYLVVPTNFKRREKIVFAWSRASELNSPNLRRRIYRAFGRFVAAGKPRFAEW